MKRICSLILVVALIFTLCSCKKNSNDIFDISSYSEPTKSSEVGDITNETGENTVSKIEMVDAVSSTTISNSNESTSSKPTVDNTLKEQPKDTISKTTHTEEIPQEETSSNQPTESEPSVDTNSEDIPLDEIEESAGYYKHQLNGTIVDWFVEGELVYAVFKSANRYSVFDTNTGEIVADYALSGKPAKMHNYGDELWISYPDLQYIKIYDKHTFEVKNTINLQNSVSSFDKYNDYLIYTDNPDNRSYVKVYRYNLKTGQTDEIKSDSNRHFYEADVLVNQQLALVYIGESNITDSRLICYDIETLELKSKIPEKSIAYSNTKRRTFLLGDSVYWGEFRVDAADVSKIKAQYSGTFDAGMLHVDEIFVATTNGIYIRETCEQVISNDIDFFFSAIAITNSGNILIVDFNKLYIFVNDK